MLRVSGVMHVRAQAADRGQPLAPEQIERTVKLTGKSRLTNAWAQHALIMSLNPPILRDNLTCELVWRDEDRIRGGTGVRCHEVSGGDLLGRQSAVER